MGAANPTLVLGGVTKRVEDGRGECVVLDGASLEIDAGEVVGVWGRRRAGRSMLSRVVAGVEPPDAGTVRVRGVDLWAGTASQQHDARRAIALWHSRFPVDHGRWVHRQVGTPVRRGFRSGREVRAAAIAALSRVGVGDCAGWPVEDLGHREAVRVALARALVKMPELLVLDDALIGLEPLDANDLLDLIVRLAREDQIAVLVTASDAAQLGGVDRHLSVSAGVLRGAPQPEPGSVVKIREA